MRATTTSLLIAASAIAITGCFYDPEDAERDWDETHLVIDAADCTALGKPIWGGNCTKTANATTCNRLWEQTGTSNPGWDPGKPVCLGFGTDIDDCDDCNRLNVPDNEYDLCLNKLFVECLEGGFIPGNTGGKDWEYCFVTDPDDLTKPDKWPDSGQATLREMCHLGVPSDADVTSCRKKASCDEDKTCGINFDGSPIECVEVM